MNQAADRWCAAQAAAKTIAAELGVGSYVFRWEDDESETPDESTLEEIRKALKPRGLGLETDDRGLFVMSSVANKPARIAVACWEGWCDHDGECRDLNPALREEPCGEDEDDE